MNSGPGPKKNSKKNSDDLDDILGDLLSDDTHARKKPGPAISTRQKTGPDKGAKPGAKSENFYSSLAVMADSDEGSVISEADVNKLAHSLGDLDDMDADLFGDALNKKGSSGGKPTTPRHNTQRSKVPKSPTRVQSPTRGDTPTSPPGSARTSLKRKPVKPPSPSATPSNPPVFSPRQIQPEHKPGTAPGKMTDLSSASESLLPGQKIHQRPETAPKTKKKFDFGDFDPDDPLAGVLSGSDDISENDRPKSATSLPRVPEDVVLSGKKGSHHDSPRRGNLMDRPPTRSGSSPGENSAPTAIKTVADVDSSLKQTATKTQAGGIFSDSDDLLDGLGLDEKTVTPAKQNDASQKVKTGDDEDIRPARSVFDSLLGKGSSTAAQILERKEKKEFILDQKYSSSLAGSAGGKDEEEGFLFGSYQPSAAVGSRPNSRRSVRFQDDDDIFGLESRPSPRSKSPGVKKAPPDMEWLETAAKSSAPTTAKAASVPQQGAPTTIQADGVTSATKPPAISTLPKTPESPKTTISGGERDSSGVLDSSKRSSIASAGPSAGAWLGLEDSGSDDELFKPKKSPAHTAGLPQSPAVSSVSASPRILPKKPSKKTPAPATVSPTVSNNPQDDDDDWLARARSRRQQMLAREEGKGAGDMPNKNTASVQKEEEAGGQNMKVDFAALNIDQPFEGRTRNDMSNDLFSVPQGQPPRAPGWESLKTTQNVTTSGEQMLGIPSGQMSADFHSPQQGPSLDTRFPAAVFEQEQPPSKLTLYGEQKVLSVSQQPEIQQGHQYLFQQQLLHQQQHQPQLQQHQFQLQLHPHVQEQEKFQQLAHQQKQQQQLLLTGAQSQTSDVAVPSYSQITSTIRLPDSLPEAQTVIRKLELEKSYSESLLESTRRRFEEEMLAVETSYKNRLQIIEDSNRKREARLREENEELMQQHLAKFRQLEQEKSDQSLSHYRRLEDLEGQKAEDLEKLREQNRLALATLKREHEEALERLASAKNQEINMVANANDTSRSLTAVVQQIQNNARDLGELQMKVESWNRQGLDEREISLRSKDEQLRILQDRLNRQAEDNDRERKRLEDLIAQMEAQLRDQTRKFEEERWKLKHDQGKVEAQQRSLEEEKRQWLEQQARERISIERARENYLEEQSRSVTQISEERRMLTEERTKFQIELKAARDKASKDAMKQSQAEADYEALMRTIAEEKAYQSTRRQELQREEEKISSERSKLEREKSKLEQDQEKLASQARQIREQSEQIDRLTEAARRSQQEGEQALEEAAQYRAHLERKEADIQKQLNGLKLMEDHISQEKLRLAKEKKEVENLKNSSLCANCRSPLHGNNVPIQNGYHSPQLSTTGLPSISAVHVNSSTHQLITNPLDQIAFSIANDRAVRMMKIQAIKDKEFLQEENIYLEGLRHAPYHSTASKS